MCLKRTFHPPTYPFRAVIFAATISIVSMLPARAQVSVNPQRGVLTLAPVIAPIMPAVVQIIVQQQRTQASGPNPVSAGSGVIVDSKDGYILTNHHVIANGLKIRVKLVDERVFDA